MKPDLRYEHFKSVILRSLLNCTKAKDCYLQRVFWEGSHDLNIDPFNDRIYRSFTDLRDEYYQPIK